MSDGAVRLPSETKARRKAGLFVSEERSFVKDSCRRQTEKRLQIRRRCDMISVWLNNFPGLIFIKK